jgi:predicted SAM-dependent methyltransferase
MLQTMPSTKRRALPRTVPVGRVFRSAQQDLQAIGALVEAVAGDLAAHGPTGGTRRIATRLRRWRRDAEALARDLRARRDGALTTRLRALGLASASHGLKLHLGAADASLTGWVNVDRWPAELSMDLRWGLPFVDGAADLVYLCHVLEHFYYPDEARCVLEDIRRVLAPRGTARIVVPDIGRTLRAYVGNDRRFFAARRAMWPWWPKADSRLEQVLGYAGVGAGPADFGGHRFGYDFETLRALLRRAGFTRIVRSHYMRSRHPDLRVDEASHVAGAKVGRRYFSLFVDAQA